MFYIDLVKLAFANLFRSRLRTILTVLGCSYRNWRSYFDDFFWNRDTEECYRFL